MSDWRASRKWMSMAAHVAVSPMPANPVRAMSLRGSLTTVSWSNVMRWRTLSRRKLKRS